MPPPRALLLLAVVGLYCLAACFAAPAGLGCDPNARGCAATAAPGAVSGSRHSSCSSDVQALPRPAPGETQADAAPLVSGTVSGGYYFTNFPEYGNVLDPANPIPFRTDSVGYGNSLIANGGTSSASNVPIQAWPAGAEFAYLSSSLNVIINIEGSQLTLTFTTFTGTLGAASFPFTFSDTFPGSAVSLVSSNLPNSNWVAGTSSVTLSYADISANVGDVFTVIFSLASSVSCAGSPLPQPVLNAGGWLSSCTSTASAGVACPATCRAGYVSVPTPTITCGVDGKWVPPAAGSQCYRACDTNPPPLDGGSWNCVGTPIRGRCVGSCGSGLVGTPFRQCNAGGWGPQIGKCVTAPACLGAPTATVLNGAWPLSCYDSSAPSSCTATCNPGYTGSASVSCVEAAPSALNIAGGASWETTVQGACRRN